MPPPTPDFDHSLEDLTPSLSLSGEVIGDKSQELPATPAKVVKSPRRQSHGSAGKQKSPDKAKAASLVVSEPVKNTVIGEIDFLFIRFQLFTNSFFNDRGTLKLHQ